MPIISISLEYKYLVIFNVDLLNMRGSSLSRRNSNMSVLHE